jgi:hypothetical protein
VIDLFFSGILRTTEVGENQQINESTGIVLDTEPHEFKMIQHDENVEVCLKLDPPFFI